MEPLNRFLFIYFVCICVCAHKCIHMCDHSTVSIGDQRSAILAFASLTV